MEFAISAVLLLALLLPGFITQLTYTKGSWHWNSPTSTQTITEQIPSAVVLSGVLHTIWATAAFCLNQPINLDATVMLLLGSYGHDDVHFDTTIAAFSKHSYQIFWYFLTLYIASALSGYFGHSFVRKRKLDLKSKFFRFNNEWYYLLSGEILEFSEVNNSEGEIDGVYLTTVVHHNDKDYLYRGIVADFYFDKSGSLDRILMRLAHRRCLSNDRELGQPFNNDDPAFTSDDRYYDIEGDYFLLRYSEMSTINVDYIFVTKEEDS